MKATFAAGCFWGVQLLFDQTPGVLSTRVGYTGGTMKNPTYENVCSDDTGHAEAVEITYDEKKVKYEKLLDIFWENHNPTTPNRQGPDEGSQYRSAIFYHDEEQRKIAEQSRIAIQKKFKDKVVTQIVKATAFYPAEEYHQKYLEKRGQKTCS
ncbi:MAG TPA: peptide-methionine (S)-S-oxide reductase MsrA [Candidatus Binatia bacterium]|nr:peptide-methionine (S)-S-oxide reductase MsrA [Candidatus Binatia bacterium]